MRNRRRRTRFNVRRSRARTWRPSRKRTGARHNRCWRLSDRKVLFSKVYCVLI